MENLLVNLGRAVPRTMGGRNYLVAPITLIVPGVLNGSQGAIYYPEDEVSKWPGLWNHVPLVVYHPVREGQHVSARDAEVLDNSGIGLILGDHYTDGKRGAQGWFDVELTKKVDRTLPPADRIFPKLQSGQPIEISTGLDLDKEPAPEGAAYNGAAYLAIARNFRPDHLAILPDVKGACSNNDGCGVNVNENSNQGETMTRNEMLQYLTTNCECHGNDKDRLEKMPDEKLKKLVGNARILLVVNQIKNKKNANAGGDAEAVAGVPWTELAVLLGVDLNPADDPIEFAAALKAKVDEISSKLGGASAEPDMDDVPLDVGMSAPDDEPVAAAAGTQEVDKVGNRKRVQSSADWLKTAPPEIRSAVTNAMHLEKQAKARLVQRLVGNIAKAQERQAMGAKLMAKSLTELQELASLIPEASITNSPPEIPNFAFAGGAGGGSILGNEGEKDDSDNLLPTFSVNFEEMASPKLRQQSA